MTSDWIFKQIAEFGDKILFWDVFWWSDKLNIPFLIFFLLFASVYFSFITGFVNIRKLPYAIVKFIKSKGTVNQKDGTISSKSIVLSAIGGAADLGSLFGLAEVVRIGGAGTIFWLVVAGFVSTSVRYAEVICGHKFRRKVFKNGVHSGYDGGPQIYIRRIFSFYKMRKLGMLVVSIYSSFLMLSTFCSLQVNQSVHVITHSFPVLEKYTWILALMMATGIIFIAVKGIGYMAKFNQKVVPVMVGMYVIITFVIVLYYHSNIIPCLHEIISDAFSFRAVNGGILGAMVLGVRRAFFCNESGTGSGAILHANSSNKNTREEAIISIITPIVSVLVVCLCSGLIVVLSGVYKQNIGDNSGVDIMLATFASVHPLLKYAVIFLVPIFGFTTAISWAYYGSKQFASLFGRRRVMIYYTLLFVAYFLCGVEKDFSILLDVADFFGLAITIPNIIAVAMMTKMIRRETFGRRKRKNNK